MNGVFHRIKHAAQVQNVFRHVVRRTEELGMVVYSSKSAMICVSGAEYNADAYILDENQSRIGCTDSIKALGVYFSNDLSMERHVRHIIKSVRTRYWTLRNPRANGFNTEELVQVYKTVIRHVTEYGCVAFHLSLMDDQDERIERLQDHALKCIYGSDLSVRRRLRGLAGVVTLRERREELARKFAVKCSNDPAFDHWFPKITARRSLRNAQETYREEKARCERLKNSPLFYFRRRLNGKVGKVYGERNRR